MPRIRKKTSNRGTTNNRKKIQQKVRETRKKRTRDAKTNPQWKSKQPKDPGIPNDFPYKDQILAEVQEQRRLELEEKQRRKLTKKALKSGVEANTEDLVVDENAELKDFDGVASIAAKSLRNVKLTRMERPAPPVVVEEEIEEEEPALFNRDLTNLKTVLEHADVVLQVLDCRDPMAFRSTKIEELSKRTILVLNKIDLCPQEAVSGWVSRLRADHPTVLFRSASAFVPSEVQCSKEAKGKGKVPIDNAWGTEALLKALGEAAQKKSDEPLAVAVVGFTNVGKSSIINSIAKKAILPIYSIDSMTKTPTTTVLPQEVIVEVEGRKIRLLDTPGISWESTELTTENRARDILLRNRGRIDRLKEPMAPVTHIVSRANNEDLMVHYSLPAFQQGDFDAFLPGVARSKQLIKRRGAIDLISGCRVVLREWNTGVLRWYTTAPSTPVAELDEADKTLISSLPTRKELRKVGGLVRISTGEIDDRLPSFEEPYTAADSDAEDEDDEEQVEDDLADGDIEDELDVAGDDEAEIDEEEEEVVEEEEEDALPAPAPPLSGKQKRKRGKESSLPASKKVAMGAKKQSVATKSKAVRKVANTPSKSKAAATAALSNAAGGDAYDFGKYF